MRENHCAPSIDSDSDEPTRGSDGDTPERLSLSRCESCRRYHYPAREFCPACLSPRVNAEPVDGSGTVCASTTIFRTTDPRFESALPLHVGTVHLRVGPLVLAFLSDPALAKGDAVRVSWQAAADGDGSPVLVAKRC